MCLTILAQNVHPNYKLVLASNRDEFHVRPTAAAHHWDTHPHIFAGRDLQAGGTWLGVNSNGRVVNLTNYRDFTLPQKVDPPSRGKLVVDLLSFEENPEQYIDGIGENADAYPGFSILFGAPDQLRFYSNMEKSLIRIEDGLAGMSNHLLDTPWPKLTTAKQLLGDWTDAGSTDYNALFDLLGNKEQYEDHLLPDTGAGIEFERKASPIFILDPVYGTRTSTVLLVGHDGEALYAERHFDQHGNETERAEHRLKFDS